MAPRPAHVLIVDDERAARRGMCLALEDAGYRLSQAENGQEALDFVTRHPVDLVLCDLNMPEMSGMEFLSALSPVEPRPSVIMVTAYGSEQRALECWQRGAQGYLRKPFENEELRLTVQRELAKRSLVDEKEELAALVRERQTVSRLKGESQAMGRVFDTIDKVAATDVTVLIRGESGTGKELVAREIHQRSGRAAHAFVSMNCAALPETLIESELFGHEKGAFTGAHARREGKFQVADHGTLFLDEIGDMSLNSQSKLLRVLEERRFQRVGGNEELGSDVRLITATNQDLQKRMALGEFREDLYFRIKVVEVALPSLRERGEDVVLLARHFLKTFAALHHKPIDDISEEALRRLGEHSWPGNVRELRNTVESAVVLTDGRVLGTEHLPDVVRYRPPAALLDLPDDWHSRPFQEVKRVVVESFERSFITHQLKRYHGNVSKSAEALGMHRQSLQQKMRELGLDRADFDRPDELREC